MKECVLSAPELLYSPVSFVLRSTICLHSEIVVPLSRSIAVQSESSCRDILRKNTKLIEHAELESNSLAPGQIDPSPQSQERVFLHVQKRWL